MPGLVIRKVADTSNGTRVARFDSITGERVLVNPATNAPEPWPLAGVRIGSDPAERGADEPHDEVRISTNVIADGIREGWVTLEDEEVVHRPGGPADNQWAITHTFRQASAVVFHTLDGDIRYRVVHNPDKYADPGDDDTRVTDKRYADGKTRVDWFYDLTRED